MTTETDDAGGRRQGLPSHSIAGLVLDPRAALFREVPRARGVEPGSIAAIVLAHVQQLSPVRPALGGAFVIGSLACVAAALSNAPVPEVAHSVRATSTPIRLEHIVELSPEAPSLPPPPEPRVEATRRVPTRAPRRAHAAAGAGPPPPAQAGELVATSPDDPLDFTEVSMVSGDAPKFAGGVTAPSGTNEDAVHTSSIDPNARPGRPQGEGSLARAVRLPARNWRCPWPPEAQMLGIAEQTVLVRVMVDATGVAKNVTLLADPGHGFGSAAVACARTAQFEPARDARGAPYAATSPPIRVRFTR